MTTAPELIYYVTTESDTYGPDCTTEQAETIAAYIVDRMADYAERQGYAATIRTISHGVGDVGTAHTAAGDAALEDMAAYDEAHWVDWAAAALGAEEQDHA